MVRLSALFGLLAVRTLATASPGDADRRGLTSTDDVAADMLFPRTHGGSADFSSGIASGLSACSAGASSGSVDSSHKAALASWCKSSGSQYFSQDIVGEISSWCSGAATATLSASTCTSIQSGLKSSQGKSWGSCSLWGWLGSFMGGISGEAFVAADTSTQSDVQTFIKGSSSAQADYNTLGALKICGAGGAAASLNAKAKSDCMKFLSKPGCPLEAKVIAGVKAWLQGKGGSGQSYCSVSASAGVSASVSASVGASATVSVSESVGISFTVTTPAAATTATPPAAAPTTTPVGTSSSDCSCSDTTVETTLSTAAVPTGPAASTSLTSESTIISSSATSNTAFSSTAPVASTSSVVPFTGAAMKGMDSFGIVSLLVGVLGSYLVMI